MFIKYDKTDKIKFIVAKVIIFILIILAALLAMHLAKVDLPKATQKVSWGFGLTLIAFIVALAYLNRLKMLFKIKSIGFLVAFVILSLLRVGIDALVWGTGLVSIPLLIDDIFVVSYFKYLDIKKYGGK